MIKLLVNTQGGVMDTVTCALLVLIFFSGASAQERQLCFHNGQECKVSLSLLSEVARPSHWLEYDKIKREDILKWEAMYTSSCSPYYDDMTCKQRGCAWDDEHKACVVSPNTTVELLNSATFNCDAHAASEFFSCAIQTDEADCRGIGCEAIKVDPIVVQSGYYRLMDEGRLCVSKGFFNEPHVKQQEFIRTMLTSAPFSGCPEARAKLAYFTLCAYRGRDSCVADPMCWWLGDMCLTRDMVTLSVMWGTIPQAKVISDLVARCSNASAEQCGAAVLGTRLPRGSFPQIPPLIVEPPVGPPPMVPEPSPSPASASAVPGPPSSLPLPGFNFPEENVFQVSGAGPSGIDLALAPATTAPRLVGSNQASLDNNGQATLRGFSSGNGAAKPRSRWMLGMWSLLMAGIMGVLL